MMNKLLDSSEYGLYIKAGCALLAAAWGDLNPLVHLLILLMVIDIASGILVAFAEKKISSVVSGKGMARKAMILLLVGTAAVLDLKLGLSSGMGLAVAGFYAAHELLSIFENAGALGIPIPKVLRDALAKLNPPEASPEKPEAKEGP